MVNKIKCLNSSVHLFFGQILFLDHRLYLTFVKLKAIVEKHVYIFQRYQKIYTYIV